MKTAIIAVQARYRDRPERWGAGFKCCQNRVNNKLLPKSKKHAPVHAAGGQLAVSPPPVIHRLGMGIENEFLWRTNPNNSISMRLLVCLPIDPSYLFQLQMHYDQLILVSLVSQLENSGYFLQCGYGHFTSIFIAQKYMCMMLKWKLLP